MTESSGTENEADAAERIEVQRVIPADPGRVFAVLCDPQGHVAIDASGMLMDSTGEPATQAGDEFVIHMDRQALNDYPIGRYDVTVIITAYEADREVAWTVASQGPSLGHVYGYLLEPVDEGTLVTSYYDWSEASEDLKTAGIFPVISETGLRATLGILDRTVVRSSGS
jgi:hypothetical protein